MKRIIAPIEKRHLVNDLTPERFIGRTGKGGNELYSFSFHDSSHLMMEVARLREVSYRTNGVPAKSSILTVGIPFLTPVNK